MWHGEISGTLWHNGEISGTTLWHNAESGTLWHKGKYLAMEKYVAWRSKWHIVAHNAESGTLWHNGEIRGTLVAQWRNKWHNGGTMEKVAQWRNQWHTVAMEK